MQDVRDALGIKIESPYWDEAYKKAVLFMNVSYVFLG